MGEKMKKIKDVFWRKGGYTAQNHAFILFTTPYALMWISASIMTLFGIPIDPTFMQLLEIMQTPMLVVLGGIFSVSVAHEVRRPNGDKNHINTNQSQGNPQVDQDQKYYTEYSDQNTYDDYDGYDPNKERNNKI